MKDYSSPLQVSSGYEAGSEAAIHSMKAIFEDDQTQGIILVDASNAFNNMNWKVAQQNIRIICPVIATYLANSYASEARMFIHGKFEISSSEGTVQGDPLAMPWFSLNTLTLIEHLSLVTPGIKQVWLADDASAGGSLDSLVTWYGNLIKTGEKFGYYVNLNKSRLILNGTMSSKYSYSISNYQHFDEFHNHHPYPILD